MLYKYHSIFSSNLFFFVLHDDDDDHHHVQVHVFIMYKNESIQNKNDYNDDISLRTLSFFFFLSLFLSIYKCEYLIVMVECVVFRVICIYIKKRYDCTNMMQFNDRERH
jgi:hypothetical protein